MIDGIGSTDSPPDLPDGTREAVNRLAGYVQTGGHLRAQVLAGYAPVTYWVVGAQRKLWGSAMRLALERWEDSAGVGELVGVLRQIVDDLLALGEGFKSRSGNGLACVVASLAHVVVALRAAERRLKELQSAGNTTPGVAADSGVTEAAGAEVPATA